MIRGFGLVLLMFLAVIGIYLVWRIGGQFLINYCLEKNKNALWRIRAQSKAIIIGLLILITASLINVACLNIVMSPDIDPKVISANNNILMEYDHKLYGVYPTLWMQSEENPFKPMIDATVPFFIFIYNSLSFVLSFTLILLFFFRTRLCLELILAFCLCSLVSMPFWYIFPSISPVIAYWEPILLQDIPVSIRTALDSYVPSDHLSDYLQGRFDFKNSIKSTTLIVTTIPSMHIAWSFLYMYYLIAYSRVLSIVAVPLFVFSSISTVITLQHYAVDTPAGILAALIAIYLAKLIVDRIEVSFDPIKVMVEEDVGKCCKWVQRSTK